MTWGSSLSSARERRRDRAQELEWDAQQIRGRLDELDKQLTHQMNVLIEQLEERRRLSPTVEMSERIGAFKLLRDEMEHIAGDPTLDRNEQRRQIKFLQEAFLRVGRHD